MKPYLVVDEGASKERNYERLVKIWGHPELVDALLPKLNSDKDFFAISSITCQNRVHLEVVLHPLADVNDVTAIKEFVETSWDEMGEDLLEIEPESELPGEDWVDYKGLNRIPEIDRDTISGLGDLFRPKTREQKRLLMTLLFDAARNLYDIGSADIRDEDFLKEEPEPVPDEEEAEESETE